MSKPASLLGPARERASRGDIALHDHVCGIYETREEQYEPACAFLKLGLERQEQCLYIVERQTPAEFMSFMDARGVNTAEATRNGSLLVVSGKDIRAKLGGFTPGAMLSFLAEAERKALEGGFKAFRLAAEMTWLRQDNITPADMFSYEAALNRVLLEREIVALCQYAIEDFKSELLIAAAETHPLLVYDEFVCDNFYYIPPEEYLKPQFADMKLRRILFNILSREQFMHGIFSGRVSPSGKSSDGAV